MIASRPVEPRRPADMARLELARLSPGPEHSLEAIFRQICEIASETLDVSRVGIWFYIGNRQALRCVNLYERESREHSSGVTLQVADFPSYFADLEERRSIPAEVAGDDPRTRQLSESYLKPLGISSMLDAPIYRDGQVIGSVCHEHTGAAREWTTEERDFASSVADCVALKLKAADLNDARAVLQQSDDVLIKLERADSMARIAAEAAHDFKNVLTVVIGFANELVHAREMPPDLREMASHILKAGEHGTRLVQQMSAYGHADADSPEAVVVGEVIQRMLPLLRRAAGPKWEIRPEIEAGPGRVFVDPSQIERVAYNLVLNARDAMPEGGAIQLRVATEAVDDDPIRAGNYSMLAVTDNGVGMDAATLARLFEPFFTTKPRGQGTGLGMAIVKRIVDRAGGFIRVDSDPGRGTNVRVYFPFVSRVR